jgi:cytochrome b pre-mRNA-processing protein 3
MPVFYQHHGVPDTLDGRFELIVLHAFLVLHRLSQGTGNRDFGQAFFDFMFMDMDRSLREMGTGDLSVGKQVKQMATGFYGRTAAYQEALADPVRLRAALKRNLFGTVTDIDERHVAWFAEYLPRQAQALTRHDAAVLTRGEIEFADVG